VLQLQQQADAIQTVGLRVLVVTFEGASPARRYVDETQLPWPLLIDEKRELYQAFTMGAGSRWDVLGPASWSVYFKLMARGRLPRRPTGDITQLGGDVLIDPSGIVRLHHVGTGPADRPSVESLLHVVRPASKD
jgi:hypothetical protein